MKKTLSLILMTISLTVYAKVNNVIPAPQKITYAEGAFSISKLNYFIPAGWEDERTAFMIGELEKKFGGQGDGLNVKFIKRLFPNDEAYTLIVDAKQGVTIEANNSKGWLYAAQTLMQMADDDKGLFRFENVKIEDYPAFPIRGFMNDMGRNYMEFEMIKEVMDVMARYKMNIYHFHASDDPAFRIESKRYPQLNFPENMSRNPGKLFTQAQIKELIHYAKIRNITLIPEIDMPGHCAAFRKAMGFKNMEDPAATKVLCDLIEEVASLATVEDMPYIHIGTDEARGANEKVSEKTVAQYISAVEKTGRRAICWCPGLREKNNLRPIIQTWTGRAHPPWNGFEFIDSQENYLNHLDPFEAIMTLYFRKNCDFKNAKGLGGILCAWPDIEQNHTRNHFKQIPVFASIVTYSEALWRASQPVDRPEFFLNLPPQGHPALAEFKAFEDKLLLHRDRYFKDQEFQYVRQTNIPWKIIGPIPHGKNTLKKFPIEDSIDTKYEIDGKTYEWHNDIYTGATITFKHYCDYPTLFNGKKLNAHAGKNSTFYALSYIHSDKDQVVPFWISGHTWASSCRKFGLANVPGKWFHADPQFFVNDVVIPAPKWEKNNTKGNDPYIDENYFYRKSTPIALKKGWNKILVKSPNNDQTRRWMFTFVPVQTDDKNLGCNVKEFPGLRFSTQPQ